MLNFDYCNPTRYVFGPGEHRNLGTLLRPVVRNKVLLHYGGGSVIRSGLLDTMRHCLKEAGIDYVELGGVKPNPSVTLVRKGIELCRRENVDLVLAVGGGSVIDSAKAIAMGAMYDGDVWDFFNGTPVKAALPVGAASAISSPMLVKMRIIARTTVVLPVPGPPVSTNTEFATASFIARFCSSS